MSITEIADLPGLAHYWDARLHFKRDGFTSRCGATLTHLQAVAIRYHAQMPIIISDSTRVTCEHCLELMATDAIDRLWFDFIMSDPNDP